MIRKLERGYCDMKRQSGYYISAYCSIDSLGNVLGTGLRHDQNISLWHFDGKKLELLRHWELERITGMKHHDVAFYNYKDFEVFLNHLLKEFEIDLSDIVKIIGMEKENFDYDAYSYHSLCHLYGSMMSDTSIFYNENILGLSLDAGPDFSFENDSDEKKYYVGVDRLY
jgi:hypothetical protein